MLLPDALNGILLTVPQDKSLANAINVVGINRGVNPYSPARTHSSAW